METSTSGAASLWSRAISCKFDTTFSFWLTNHTLVWRQFVCCESVFTHREGGVDAETCWCVYAVLRWSGAAEVRCPVSVETQRGSCEGTASLPSHVAAVKPTASLFDVAVSERHPLRWNLAVRLYGEFFKCFPISLWGNWIMLSDWGSSDLICWINVLLLNNIIDDFN